MRGASSYDFYWLPVILLNTFSILFVIADSPFITSAAELLNIPDWNGNCTPEDHAAQPFNVSAQPS